MISVLRSDFKIVCSNIVNNQFIHMSSFRNTFIQENHPETRRRSLTTLESLIRNTRAESFLSYISQIKNHKKTLRQSEEAISSHFKKINNIICMVDDHIFRRLQNHQSQIFAIFKQQIEEMKQETRQAVQKLNNLIIKKNNQDEVWDLSNQLDYFKSEALKLFNQNKKMREQISKLKLCLKQADVQLQNSDRLMQNLRKKYVKQNFIKEKLVLTIKQKIKSQRIQQITKQTIDQILKMQKIRNRITIKTEQGDYKQKGNENLKYRIRLFLSNDTFIDKAKQDKMNEKPSQRLSCPSSLSQDFSNSEIQSIQYVQTTLNKQLNQQIQKGRMTKKVQSFTQTDNYLSTVVTSTYEVPRKHLSNTIYVQMPRQSKKLSLDIRKTKLYPQSSNKSTETIEISTNKQPKFNQTKRHIRYMSLAFNKNKIFEMQHEKKASYGTIAS